MIKITGLYKSKTAKGDVYLSGKAQDGVKYLVFVNKKTKSNHPDYNLYKEDIDKKQSGSQPSAYDEFQKQVEPDDDFPF